VVTLSLLPPHWDGEENQKEKAKINWLVSKQFNRTAKGADNKNKYTDKNNIQSAIFPPPKAQLTLKK